VQVLPDFQHFVAGAQLGIVDGGERFFTEYRCTPILKDSLQNIKVSF
jgi:hypothetical protein